ncbi:uncharacterized protein LOC120690179 isoform X1 [Panicum virgatum]|uniref:uncharacterized protein LOC120690179 isoform X1 n=1 Tax=Panicum virgatum TaxID=38727 RepID=UPI0019D5A8F1|nr:uncharacterized protein LOC120690179 isoform X1 [Panicum virgatum]
MLIRRGGGRCASRGKQEGANLDERHGRQAPSIRRAHKPAFVQEFGKNYLMRNRRQLGSLVRHFFLPDRGTAVSRKHVLPQVNACHAKKKREKSTSQRSSRKQSCKTTHQVKSRRKLQPLDIGFYRLVMYAPMAGLTTVMRSHHLDVSQHAQFGIKKIAMFCSGILQLLIIDWLRAKHRFLL